MSINIYSDISMAYISKSMGLIFNVHLFHGKKCLDNNTAFTVPR